MNFQELLQTLSLAELNELLRGAMAQLHNSKMNKDDPYVLSNNRRLVEHIKKAIVAKRLPSATSETTAKPQ